MSTPSEVLTDERDYRRGRSVIALIGQYLTSLRQHKGEEMAFVVSNAIVNVANFGFFVAVGRLFDPASYGAISALLSIVTIANTPLNAVQAGVVHATAVARQSLSEHSPRKVIAIFTVVGLVTTGLVAAISPFLERFFSIAGFFPVLMLALWFAPSVVNSALCGSLMGHFKFRVIAVANVVGAVARISLVLVFGLSRNFLGLAGPILATSAGITITSVWIFVAVRREASWRAGKPLQLHLGHTSWAFVSLTGFAMFAAIDVVLARHLLPATIAGNYAVASTAGKIALFLTVAVPIVAYPRFAAQQASGVSSRRELFYALAIVAVVGLLAAGTMSAVPGVVVRMLFGPRYASAAPTLRVLAPESAIMGVVGLLTYYHVARRSAFAITPWLGVAIATLSMTIAHLNAHDLAMLMLFTSIFVSVAMIVPVIAAPSSRRSLPLALSDPTGV